VALESIIFDLPHCRRWQPSCQLANPGSVFVFFFIHTNGTITQLRRRARRGGVRRDYRPLKTQADVTNTVIWRSLALPSGLNVCSPAGAKEQGLPVITPFVSCGCSLPSFDVQISNNGGLMLMLGLNWVRPLTLPSHLQYRNLRCRRKQPLTTSLPPLPALHTLPCKCTLSMVARLAHPCISTEHLYLSCMAWHGQKAMVALTMQRIGAGDTVC